MFFVSEEGITMIYSIGGAALLSGAKQLAENRAKRELTWEETDAGWESVVNHGTYNIVYKIRQEKR